MFKAGDTILYGAHGVCTIESIEWLRFDKENKEYYILRPIYDSRSLVYVPTQNERLTGRMKRVMTKERILAFIENLPTIEPDWIENEERRKAHYREIMDNADRYEIARMIKTLYRHRQQQQASGKRLHLTDERFFKDAEKILYDEFAHVLGIERGQVLSFIADRIGRTQVS